MAWILDVILLVLASIWSVIGAKRGFVRTLIELAGYVIILVLAVNIAQPISQGIYNKMIKPSIEKAVEEAIPSPLTELDISSTDKSVAQVIENLPDSVKAFLDANGVDTEEIKQSLVEEESVGVKTISDKISESVSPPITALIRIVLISIIFIIGMFAIRLLAGFCNAVASKLPLVSSMNTSLGAVAGFVKGAAIAVLLANIFAILVSISADGVFGINEAQIESTLLFKHIRFILV